MRRSCRWCGNASAPFRLGPDRTEDLRDELNDSTRKAPQVQAAGLPLARECRWCARGPAQPPITSTIHPRARQSSALVDRQSSHRQQASRRLLSIGARMDSSRSAVELRNDIARALTNDVRPAGVLMAEPASQSGPRLQTVTGELATHRPTWRTQSPSRDTDRCLLAQESAVAAELLGKVLTSGLAPLAVKVSKLPEFCQCLQATRSCPSASCSTRARARAAATKGAGNVCSVPAIAITPRPTHPWPAELWSGEGHCSGKQV